MLNPFAKGLLVATSMAAILGALAVDLPYTDWAPWLAVAIFLGLICWLMLVLVIQYSNGHDLDIQIDLNTGQDRIVFPAEETPAKKLLQIHNEEFFRGDLTERLFETNSKRIAD